ncbi:MAG: Hcp family type VI secretion system effector [Terracidiphilus sp.]
MAVDYFLTMTGIEGEAQNASFTNQVQLLSWSWGAANMSSVSGTTGSGAGKVDLSDFSCMTNFDKSTPAFFKNIVKGAHVATGTMSALKAGGGTKPYLKVNFTEIFITGLQMSASSEAPSVSVSFTYASIEIDYSVQSAEGDLTSVGPVSFNQKTGVAS